MVRPSALLFTHTVTVTPKSTRGSGGLINGVPRINRPAFIDDTAGSAVDQRDSADLTEIATVGTVFTYLEDYAAPGSTILLRPGTPAERVVTVVNSGYFDHPEAPEHAEMRVV